MCTFGLGIVSVHFCRDGDELLTIFIFGIGHCMFTPFSLFVFAFTGDGINNYYFPFILTIGIIGNILSFMVSNVSQVNNISIALIC